MNRRVTRRAFVLGLGALPGALRAASFAHRARPQIRRIGLAFGDDPEGGVAAFRETLRELGHVEGQTLRIEARDTQKGAPGMNPTAELVGMDLELVVVHSLPLALAARAANPRMPLVVVTTPGFVLNGFAKSLDRPGGNVTGIDELPPHVTATRLQLLKEAAPAVARIALLSTTPGRGAHEVQLADAQATAAKLGVAVKPYRATSVAELQDALTAIGSDAMDGLLNFQGGLSYVNRQLIVDFAAKRRVPAIYQATVFARSGGLMTWAPDLVDQFRDAARYVDRILKGARPGDLPIRHPSRYFLTLNNSAARNLGLTFPPALVSRADRVLP